VAKLKAEVNSLVNEYE